MISKKAMLSVSVNENSKMPIGVEVFGLSREDCLEILTSCYTTVQQTAQASRRSVTFKLNFLEIQKPQGDESNQVRWFPKEEILTNPADLVLERLQQQAGVEQPKIVTIFLRSIMEQLDAYLYGKNERFTKFIRRLIRLVLFKCWISMYHVPQA